MVPFQDKYEALGSRPEIELTVLAPSFWIENLKPVHARSEDRRHYSLRTAPVVWPGYENRAFFRAGIGPAVRAARPDIVHLWEEPFSFIAFQSILLVERLAPGVPILFSSSDDLSSDFRYPYRPSWLYARIERFTHRRCAGATIVNRRVADVLRSKGFEGPLELVPHGLDPSRYARLAERERRPSPVEGTRRATIGFVGKLQHQKGIDLLLRAVASLGSNAGAHAPRLELLGEGPEEAELRALAMELGLGDRVRFRPSVPHADVPSILSEMDVLVLPSRQVRGSREHFGRVLIEGMAAGCAVVGSTSGAIPEVIGDAGLTFTEEDAEELAGVLRRLLEEPGLMESMRDRGLKRVGRYYTWDAVARTLVPFYRQILDRLK